MVGVLCILAYGFLTQIYFINENYKNIILSLNDYSTNEESPSIKILLNDELVFQAQRINEISDTLIYRLPKGKHVVTISSFDDIKLKVDTIQIEHEGHQYKLNISYKSINIIKRNMLNRLYNEAVESKNLQDTLTKGRIREELEHRVNNIIGSLEADEHFSLNIIDMSKIRIE
jgi:hypothetical protein